MTFQKPLFASPQDVEKAFYAAVQRADIEALMAVWAEDEEIVCVLPGGPRLAGYTNVREAWRRIFESNRRFSIAISQVMVVAQGMLVAVHNLHALVTIKGSEPGKAAPVLATNIYIRGANGWRMLVHHSSPTPPDTSSESSRMLH